MNKEDLKYWLALSANQKIGSKTILKLDKFYNGLEKLWDKGGIAKMSQTGINRGIYEEVVKVIKKSNLNIEFERLKKLGISVTTIKGRNYPKLLKEIPDPPAILYYKGNLLSDDLGLAVVGSRKYSSYGARAVRDFVHLLAESGLSIVSGLALGIDALAHRACLDVGGKTIGVLACGVDSVYPGSNRGLADKMLLNGGAIISEFPPGTVPLRHNFPLRNRIIAGMCMGTLVIEAARKSGTLLTARSAMDYDRNVFVVPGSIYNINSVGANNLIRYGACCVNDAKQIIEELNIKSKKQEKISKKILPDNELEAKILDNLKNDDGIHVDKLSREIGLEISKLNANLIMMEMKGMVRNLGNNLYVRN